MARRSLLFFVLFAGLVISAYAQVTNVFSIRLDDDTLPLGAQTTWTPISGATYSVYRYPTNGYQTCIATHFGWKEISTTALTQPSYKDFPTRDQYGWGGDWCYGVTDTINGVESAIVPAPKPVSMGLAYYVTWHYKAADCVTNAGQPGLATLTMTRIRNGVSAQMPAVSVIIRGSQEFVGHFRMLTTDTLTATFTLPDGKTYTFSNPFGGSSDSTPINAEAFPYLRLWFNSGNDGLCFVHHQENFQPASNN